MTITVFSKPACTQCTMTKKALGNKGFTYVEKEIYEQPDEWLDEIKSENLLSAPIVQVDYASGGQIRWAGFRPDLINDLRGDDAA
ncbi:glutaredoxin domain-containing protein [Brevibacterium sp. CFH 10365]|uniref:glutaredoxin domain-containing protein n=1 Tax=Brevibacterium sp. CFH 10365 TaxID=2585207 RepID=UPI001D0CF904|nr:glutaredoxin domain-containing protein [Brevibacterium sp. CFH 10365]